MELVTQSHIAKLAGVSRQAVSQLVAKGLLKTHGKKVDLSDPGTVAYIQNAKNSSSRMLAKHSSPASRQYQAPLEDLPDLSSIPLASLSLVDANRLKTLEQIRQYQTKTDELRKNLVPRETVRSVFSKLHMIDVNQWRTLGPSLAPVIAALVGVDDDAMIMRISTEIEAEVFKILEQCKRLQNDYLVSIKSEPMA